MLPSKVAQTFSLLYRRHSCRLGSVNDRMFQFQHASNSGPLQARGLRYSRLKVCVTGSRSRSGQVLQPATCNLQRDPIELRRTVFRPWFN